MEFGEGITALVGPNGSGKSNVVDALRWVFGEQNPRSLRGRRWEEVIFAGSETRRPLGLAEVNVTLDSGGLDLPWREVEVTRRVLRSGDSEYLTGRVPCRLKDVLELAAQITAAGGGWNYIAQSGVDEILNSRPEERRAMIEEPAGLARFQSRRQEVRRRLEETEAAARRLQDLAAELQGQLEPLLAESEVAERFLTHRRELEDLDGRIWADAAARLKRRLEAALRRREALRLTVDQLEAAIAEARANLAACRANLQTAGERRGGAARREQETAAEAGQARQQLALFDGRLSASAAAAKAAAERVLRLESRVQRTERALVAAREAACTGEDAADPEGGSTSSEIASAESLQAQAAGLRTRCLAAEQDAHRRLAAVEGERAAAAEAVSGIEARAAELRRRNEALESEISRAEARRESSRIAASAAESREGDLARKIDAAKQRLVEVRRAIDEQSSAATSLREAQARLAGERAALEERLSALGSSSEETPLGAALAMKEAAQQAGIPAEGPLAELIEVDPGFERATQVALGLALCALAVNDFQAAVGLFAVRDGDGRHDPIAVVPCRVRRPQAAEREAAARTGWASAQGVDWLAAHVRAAPGGALDGGVLARLLEGWAVTGGIAQAAALWGSGGGIRAVVTKNGRAITPDGIVVAGQPGSAARVLEDRRERDRSSGRLAEIRVELEKVSAEIALREEESQRLLAEERGLREELDSAERSRAAAGADARRFAEARAREEARHEDLMAQRARVRGELSGLSSRLEAARASAEQKVRACAELQAEAEEASRLLREAEERLESRRRRVEELKLAAARAEEETRSRAAQFRRLAEERDQLGRDLEEAAAEERNGRAEVEELRKNRSEVAARLEELEGRAAGLRRAAHSAAAELQAAEAAVARAGDEVDRLGAERDKVLGRLRGVEMLVERLQGERKSLEVARNGLADRFGDLEPSLSADREQLLARRSELGDLLAAMGEVNLSAAEQCRRLRERLAYLARQEEDLRVSKEDLLSSAGELEAEMARRFQATFDECRTRFGQVFYDLFAGGQADLVLTDPEDPMSSGVDIVAQPPGKRLAGLGLLSGGERALTAVALLFAMAGGNAGGFMVLDEVDAYLDDPNCARFCRYLQRLACERQFVVITHNRATMEVADTLYGLTMEEEGVSRVVSVRLDRAAAAGGQG